MNAKITMNIYDQYSQHAVHHCELTVEPSDILNMLEASKSDYPAGILRCGVYTKNDYDNAVYELRCMCEYLDSEECDVNSETYNNYKETFEQDLEKYLDIITAVDVDYFDGYLGSDFKIIDSYEMDTTMDLGDWLDDNKANIDLYYIDGNEYMYNVGDMYEHIKDQDYIDFCNMDKGELEYSIMNSLVFHTWSKESVMNYLGYEYVDAA